MPDARLANLRSRCFLLALIACSSLVTSALQQVKNRPESVLEIREAGRSVVALDRDWQFHTGDDLRWADSAYDDSQWERIKADDTWGTQTHPAYTGFAWYRRHLK